MALLDQIKSLGLTPVQMAIVVAGGLLALVIAFKVAKLAIKLLLGLVALGLLGLGVLWLLAHV
jgi:hypothetical protein